MELAITPLSVTHESSIRTKPTLHLKNGHQSPRKHGDDVDWAEVRQMVFLCTETREIYTGECPRGGSRFSVRRTVLQKRTALIRLVTDVLPANHSLRSVRDIHTGRSAPSKQSEHSSSRRSACRGTRDCRFEDGLDSRRRDSKYNYQLRCFDNRKDFRCFIHPVIVTASHFFDQSVILKALNGSIDTFVRSAGLLNRTTRRQVGLFE